MCTSAQGPGSGGYDTSGTSRPASGGTSDGAANTIGGLKLDLEVGRGEVGGGGGVAHNTDLPCVCPRSPMLPCAVSLCRGLASYHSLMRQM
jgi:hypothetical protein